MMQSSPAASAASSSMPTSMRSSLCCGTPSASVSGPSLPASAPWPSSSSCSRPWFTSSLPPPSVPASPSPYFFFFFFFFCFFFFFLSLDLRCFPVQKPFVSPGTVCDSVLLCAHLAVVLVSFVARRLIFFPVLVTRYSAKPPFPNHAFRVRRLAHTRGVTTACWYLFHS